MTNIGVYAKAVGAAVAAAGMAAITALQDGHISNLEWVTIAGAFLVGLGAVWAVPEFPVNLAKYMKALVSGLVAGLGALSTVLVTGAPLTQHDWINILIAVVVGTGLVHITKNAPESVTLQPAPSAVVADPSGPKQFDPSNLPVDDDVEEVEDEPTVNDSNVIPTEDNFVDSPLETK